MTSKFHAYTCIWLDISHCQWLVASKTISWATGFGQSFFHILHKLKKCVTCQVREIKNVWFVEPKILFFDRSVECLQQGLIMSKDLQDQFVYVPSQWETTLQCNVVSHWLGTFTKWCLDLIQDLLSGQLDYSSMNIHHNRLLDICL